MTVFDALICPEGIIGVGLYLMVWAHLPIRWARYTGFWSGWVALLLTLLVLVYKL